MANQDFFADIAMTKHPIENQDKEIAPRALPDTVFTKTEQQCPYIPPKSYEQRLADFKQQLCSLREQYRPFMQNYLPQQDSCEKISQLTSFQFRYAAPHETVISAASGEWEKVTIPDYRGPAGEKGKWRGYYQTTFSSEKLREGEQAVLHFQSVDYKAFIYLNGVYVGQHEGFFAPFECNVTDCIKEQNTLLVEVQNDIPTLGEGPVLDGDKIYAATGIGWDDPDTGWHHCPAGAGIFGKVTLCLRPSVYINDIFARPNIDEDYVELRVGIRNDTASVAENYDLQLTVIPKNYQGEAVGLLNTKIKYIGIGENEYRYCIKLKDYRLWEPQTPWLYGVSAQLHQDGSLVCGRVRHFGMRKFVSDETSEPKGKLYFNNKPVVLRGANEMGHLQQCVMHNDYDQLMDDILIAKLCNMNYYRITQRPVQEEIYDYFDMLGMMNQCDLPLFGFLRRNQVGEAVKQAAEMEHLVRSHPSVIMTTFINEPMSIRKTDDPESKLSRRYEAKGHRHLLRDELEAFFAAARKMIYIENPDRVIKNVEGDYDPPTGEGMPDFHCYTMWYTNHAMPIGKLYKGYIPPVKEGWMIGCGEYGAEGLDNMDVMQKHYPKQWLAPDSDGNWYPDKIVKAQTNSLHGDWYPEQNTIQDWINESQRHQARATTVMTDAYRRRADRINHTALHLLIDAWPSGWMKTVVGVDRIPKPAYFAFADSLVPLRVNLRCDRKSAYSGETVPVECWLLNDTQQKRNLSVVATVRLNDQVLASYQIDSSVEAATSACAGVLPVAIPQLKQNQTVSIDAGIFDGETCLNTERMEIAGFAPVPDCGLQAVCIGEQAEKLAEVLHLQQIPFDTNAKYVIISEFKEAFAQKAELLRKMAENGAGILMLLSKGDACEWGDIAIQAKPCPEVFFAVNATGSEKYGFSMYYNQDADIIDFIGDSSIQCSCQGENLVYTYGKKGFNDSCGAKPKRPFAQKLALGSGNVTLSTLLLKGRVGVNPQLDAFLLDSLLGQTEKKQK